MPPLWPEHKNFWNTLSQKKLKISGEGAVRPLLQWGGDTPSPHSTPSAPPAPRTSRLWLCPPSQNPKYATGCIRPYLVTKTASTITTSIVHSKLDYCNSLYHNLPKSQTTRLQQIQNSLARVVVKAPKFSHIISSCLCTG